MVWNKHSIRLAIGGMHIFNQQHFPSHPLSFYIMIASILCVFSCYKDNLPLVTSVMFELQWSVGTDCSAIYSSSPICKDTLVINSALFHIMWHHCIEDKWQQERWILLLLYSMPENHCQKCVTKFWGTSASKNQKSGWSV